MYNSNIENKQHMYYQGGRCIGKSIFTKMLMKDMEDKHKEYITWGVPKIDKMFFDECKAITPERYRQLYLGEWTKDNIRVKGEFKDDIHDTRTEKHN